MKTVLITGITGFLGTYLLRELKNEYKLIVIGRNKDKLDKIYEENKDIECIQMELSDLEKVLSLPKVDIVVHAAALSTTWGKWKDFYKSNILATKNLIEYSLKNNIEKFIYISTPSVYTEKRDRIDVKEEDFNENNKLNFYIKSKLQAEKFVLESKSKDMDVVIIRPRGLVGVGDTSIIPRVLYANQKIGIPIFKENPEILMDMTSVENAAYSINLAIKKEGISGEIFNISNGEPMLQKKLLDLLGDKLNIKFRYKTLSLKRVYFIAVLVESVYKIFRIQKEPILTKYTVCSLAYSQTLNIDKAKRLLDYKPRISIEDEIKRFSDNYVKGF